MSVIESYWEDQLALLRVELREARETIAALRLQLAITLDRAEHAEDRLRILREEISDARA